MADEKQQQEQQEGFEPEDLEKQQGEELPDREAMSIIDPGGSLGAPPLAP